MERVQIIWVARSYTGPGGAVKPHKHSYYHMFYICSGQISITVADRTYELTEGACLIVPKDTEHAFRNTGNSTLEYLEIKFSCPTAALDAQLSAMGTVVSHDSLSGILAKRIVQEYDDLEARADDAASHYLLAMLYAFTADHRCDQQKISRYIHASQYTRLTQQVIGYLEEHYAESFSLDQLAQDMGRSKSYLCTRFLKDTSMTILDCLNMIRIHRAAELIVYSDYSLTQVGTMCGFASPSHFNRIFLKYAGITPGQCRKAYPDNILSNAESWGSDNKPWHPKRFVYSVLAQKRISPDMIRRKVKDE